MPKVALLSDIHGNLPALEAVLRDAGKCAADKIVFGGDIVGYGASPAECVRLVRSLGGNSVLGNHEAFTIRFAEMGEEFLREGWEENPVMAGVVHAAKTLSGDDLDWIQGLPWFLPLNGETIIAHAGLEAPNSWPYIESAETAAPSISILKDRGLTAGFFGHVHRLRIFPEPDATESQSVFRLRDKKVYAITVGSVGQPRDFSDRASWVLWDSDEQTVEFRRTEYDNKLAARQIIDAGLPARSARRLFSLDDGDDDEL